MEQTHENIERLEAYLETHKSGFENALEEYRPQSPPGAGREFDAAIDYALQTADMRVRSGLTLLGAGLVGGNAEDVLPSAVAVEFIYAGSKIFDNLPCMGDPESNKTVATIHEKFGEDMAVIVGLGLLNASYPLVFVNHMATPEHAIQAHAEIVDCVGSAGLIGSRATEIDGRAELQDFQIKRESKDSALMRLALRLGAILSGADYMELANLSRFAELLGDVYYVARGTESSSTALESISTEAKRTLIENFESSDARTCLIQLTDSFEENN